MLPRSEYVQDLGLNQDNEGCTLIRHDLERRDGSTKSVFCHLINGFNGFLGRAPARCSVPFSFKQIKKRTNTLLFFHHSLFLTKIEKVALVSKGQPSRSYLSRGQQEHSRPGGDFGLAQAILQLQAFCRVNAVLIRSLPCGR